MPAPIPEHLQKKVADRLVFYQDLGIAPFYRDRLGEVAIHQERQVQSAESGTRSTQILHEESTLPKTLRKPDLQKVATAAQPKVVPLSLPSAPGPSLFEAADRIADD